MIEFRMLGTLHLTDAAGHEVKGLLTRSHRLAQLAYPAASPPGRLHRRDSLVGLCRPELGRERGQAALRQALHVSRDTVGNRDVVAPQQADIESDFSLLWCD